VKFRGLLFTSKVDVIRVYLDYNVVSIKKQLTGNASVIKETSGKRTSVIDFTHCVHGELCAQEIVMSTLPGNMT
jgi:hypothetical protein